MLSKNVFSKKFIELRTKCGLSQNRLAQMLSISSQAISKWENAQSLPDIEMLIPIAKVFGVTVDFLLNDVQTTDCTEIGSVSSELLSAYDLSSDNSKIINAIKDYMHREDLYNAAKLMENGELDINIDFRVKTFVDGKAECTNKSIPLNRLKPEIIEPMVEPVVELITKSIGKTYHALESIVPLLHCPACRCDLKFEKSKNEELICQNNHHFRIVDGVVHFGTTEDPGNNWSYCFKSYGEYVDMQKEFVARYSTPKDTELQHKMIDYLRKRKPSIVVDVASGQGCFAQHFIQDANWPVTLILTDLSHRILKYNKRYIEDNFFNPNVRVMYIACNATNFPFKDNSIDVAVSWYGYDNIENYIKSLEETRRILKQDDTCVFGTTIVDDANSNLVKKWYDLFKKSPDWSDAENWFYDKVNDRAKWINILKDIEYKNINIEKCWDEYETPDANVVPFKNEALQWMGGAIISAKK